MNVRTLPVTALLILSLAAAGCMGAAYQAGDEAYARGDIPGAVAAYQEGAAEGDAGSLFSLGVLSAGGQGLPQDDAKALDYYEQAAALGSAEAMTVLGLRYLNGDGVVQDKARGTELLMQAAELGCPAAAAQLSFMYSQGIYLPKDETMAQAMAWTAEANGMASPENAALSEP